LVTAWRKRKLKKLPEVERVALERTRQDLIEKYRSIKKAAQVKIQDQN
jgi:hypothetical protein